MRSKPAFYLLCFIIWFVPIPLGANRPWAWGLIELLICINTILVCFTYQFNYLFERLSQIKVIFLVILFIQLWVALQWLGATFPKIAILSSLDPSQTEISLLKGVSYCLFIINFAVLVDRKDRLKLLSFVIIASGLTQALYAIYLQYSGWQTTLLGYSIPERATGAFVYWNHLANFLLLSLSAAVGYLIATLDGIDASSRRQKVAQIIETMLSRKWILRISIIIMVVALILTRSRMGNSAFFIALLFTSVTTLIIMKRPPNTLKWLVASLVVLDLVIVGAYFGVDKVKERLESTSFQAETRDDVVIDAIPYVKENLIKGSGAGSFYSTFLAYQSAPYSAFYDHAHNEYIQIAAELGILPSLLLLALIIWVILKNLLTIRRSRSRLKQGFAFAAVMACLGMIMHSSVDFVLQNLANVLLFISILLMPILNTGTYKLKLTK